ncbi:biosynthetic-type acetolactate synthase large subunit [Pumilibacter muris]|uniref:biosynthetic-type acetolactate synthase large subunit n=1 Tax=Pumilibacter muris TaxID=2941510 RepID=UPI00203BBA20|nr:biosynthetic-type acetolactate synthase large subunit [Pumilibacter muris]
MKDTSGKKGKLLRGAEIIVETLIEQGVTHVFGYPGGYIIDTFDALYLYRDKIKQILTSHEQGACHAADGYARATGRVGVVMSTSGPGATNLVTGIATAYMDSVPLVAITGNVPLTSLGRDSFQEVDITGVTMPITKHNFIVKDVSELASTLRQAFEIAASGRPGPVLVDVPKNVQQAVAEYVPASPVQKRVEPLKIDEQAREAAQILSQAKKPLIYAGGGVIISNACEKLREFAEKFGAPVASSMMGLGAMPANHPLFLGMLGMHGSAAVAKALGECDAVIAIGARFSDRVAGNPKNFCKNAKIIHIDIDSAEVDKIVNSHAHIIGDALQALDWLTENAKPHPNSEWQQRCAELKKQYPFIDSKMPLCPRKLLRALAKFSPADRIVTTDVGQHQMWAAQSYPVSVPRTFLTSGGLGTMGYGLGAALGAAVATKKPVTLITGDGSFHMNMNELPTCVKNGLEVKIFVFNNNVLGMVRQWQTLFYNKHYSSTTLDSPTDYVKLAEAFGAKGLTLDRNENIESVVKTAFSTRGTVVVDCKIMPDEFVLPMIPAGKSAEDIITEIKEANE